MPKQKNEQRSRFVVDFDSSMANEAGVVQDIAAALQVPGWFASEGNTRNTAMAKAIMEVTRYEFTKALIEVRRHGQFEGAGRGRSCFNRHSRRAPWSSSRMRVVAFACACDVTTILGFPLFFSQAAPASDGDIDAHFPGQSHGRDARAWAPDFFQLPDLMQKSFNIRTSAYSRLARDRQLRADRAVLPAQVV